MGISLDHDGNIYVAEAGGSSIRKIDTAGNVTSIAGPAAPVADYVDGKGSVARFSSPLGMCMTPGGFLVVADQFNYRVRKVTTDDGVVSTYAGELWDAKPQDGAFNGDASTATFDTPWGVATDKMGNIYVADTYNNIIRKISSAGIVSTFAGGGYYQYGLKDGQDTAARFYTPTAIAADSAGNVFVIDNESQYVRKITPDGNVTTLFGHIVPELTGPYDVFNAGALATDKYGNLFFSISVGIIKMTPDGTLIRYAVGGTGDNDGPAQVATYRAIAGIAVDEAGTIYITDNNRIRKIAWQ